MTIPFVRVVACTGLLVIVSTAAGHAQSPAPPTGLTQSISGNFVQVAWNPSPGAVGYILQAGTAPGISNLFNGFIGNVTAASGTLPSGTYFWRVLAVGPSGASSAASAESQFTIGGGGCVPPGAPQGFTANVSGLFVTLQWSPGGGGAPTTYIIEAGSASGLANLVVLPTGNAATQFATPAPPGRYFVRIRSQNACGVSGVSNEQVIDVGTSQPPGATCAFSISPTPVNVPATGGPFQVAVATQSGCRWMLQSDPFITAVSAPSGAGSANVQYTVGATGASRSGQIVIVPVDSGPVTSGPVVVQQTIGPSCAVTLSPTSQAVSPSGGQFTLRVNASAGCPWDVAPLGGFISIVSAGLRSGTDNVVYNVSANPAAAGRTGGVRVTSTVNAQDLTVSQAGVGALTASFVLRDRGQPVQSCQVSGAQACSLDASSSSPQAQIRSYSWVGFRNGVEFAIAPVANPTLNFACNPNVPPAPTNTVEPLDITLTITNDAGQTATVRNDRLAVHLAGCGQ